MAGTFLGFTSIPFEPSEIGDPGKKGLSSLILLVHHWRPCLKLRSVILIVLSTVVAKDTNRRFQS